MFDPQKHVALVLEFEVGGHGKRLLQEGGFDGTNKGRFHPDTHSLDRTDRGGAFHRRRMASVFGCQSSTGLSPICTSVNDPGQLFSDRRTCRSCEGIREMGWMHDYSSSGDSAGHRHLCSLSQSRCGQCIAYATWGLEAPVSDQCRAARASGSAWLLGRDSNICAYAGAACVEDVKEDAAGRLSSLKRAYD